MLPGDIVVFRGRVLIALTSEVRPASYIEHWSYRLSQKDVYWGVRMVKDLDYQRLSRLDTRRCGHAWVIDAFREQRQRFRGA